MLETEKTLQRERFRIVHQFGQGGKNVIYEAFDNILKTNVVLKEISVDLKKTANAAQDETRKSAFADEAKILSEIRHESLPHVHDYFSEIDHHYLVLELVDGSSLSELIEKNNCPFSFAEAADWTDQLLDALNYLHRHDPPIIHRAIKPQNIKLTTDGKIKLLDLSYAKTTNAKTAASFTNQNSDGANLQYFPLEQIWDGLDSASRKVILNSYDERSQKILEQPLDARSDIYSLGATLYQLMTGCLPVDALARSIDILEGKSDPLPPPVKLNSEIPPVISDVIMRAMEIKRENRFDSAIIMRRILQATVAQTKKQTETDARQAAEQKRRILEQEKKETAAERQRLDVEQKKQETKTENQRQAELLNQQLREADAQRLSAEQRLREKEKQVSENGELFELDDTEFFESRGDKSLSPESPTSKEIIKTETPAAVSKEEIKTETPAAISAAPVAAKQESSDESGSLFSEPQKTNHSFKRIAAVAVVLVILGGAIAGWFFLSPKPGAANQAVLEQPNPSSEPAKPAPTVENTSAPNAQTASEINNSPASSALPDASAAPVVSESATELPSSKNKFAAPNKPRLKKQILPPAKSPTTQKKAVTVDDIINDN
ncbi:MAG: protein kinase domain-containing protein [Pyrinomonadaceae bacterium]